VTLPQLRFRPLLIAVTLLLPVSALGVDINGSVREAGTGAALDGWRVTFDGAAPGQQATVAADGSFVLTGVPGTDTPLRVLTSNGEAFGRFQAVGSSANIEVEPSGHIFASDTGENVAGARVSLRLEGGGTVATMVTDKHGLYRFGLPQAGRWTLDVQVDQQRFHFPSRRLPPQPGNAVFDATTGLVAAPATPDPAAPRAYWLAFESDGSTNVAPRHNHIAVDRAGALISIEKTASKGQAMVGDVITYTVRVENRSGQDFVRVGGRGGVILRDILPTQVRLVVDSPRAFIDGNAISLARTTHPTQLDFQITTSAGETRPIELNAGARLFLRYQAVVGANSRAGQIATNRAKVVTPDGLVLSDEARVDVRIVGDPLFDKSWIRGRVFCDEDGDGWAGARDPGIYGARVYVDTGRYSITDSDGQFHLSEVPAGLHLIKVDTDTVPPGSEPVTPISRNVHFSRGIPVAVSFGFRCSSADVAPTTVVPKDAAKPPETDTRVLVTGTLDDLAVAVDGRKLEGKGRAVATIDGSPAAGAIVDVPWSPRAWDKAMGIGLQGPEGVSGTWRVWIEVNQQGTWAPMRAFGGIGPAPASLQWNGTDGAGTTPVAILGAVHRVRLEITDDQAGRWSSRPVQFTVGRGRSGAAYDLDYSGPMVGRRGRTHRKLRRFIKGLSKSLILVGSAQVVIAVGADPSQPTGRAKAMQSGELIAAELMSRSGLERPHIGVRIKDGAGVRVIVYDATAVKQTEIERPAARPARVTIGGAVMEVDKSGAFVSAVPRPSDGILAIELRDANGSVRELIARLSQTDEAPGVPVRAALGARSLTIGAVSVPLGALDLRVWLPWERLGITAGKPEAEIAVSVRGGTGAKSWRFVVVGPDKESVFEKTGPGEPPQSVVWAPEGEPLKPGVYGIAAQVTLEGGIVVQSPATTLTLEAEPTGAARGTVLQTFAGGKLFGKSDTLQKRFRTQLESLAILIRQRPPGDRFLVEVHTDGSGDPSVARMSSDLRATRIRSFLGLKGAPVDRIEAEGIGNKRPLADGTSRGARRKNERFELRLLPAPSEGPVIGPWSLSLDGEEVPLSPSGRGVKRIEPTGEPIDVVVTGRRGERLETKVTLLKAPVKKETGPKKAPFAVQALNRGLAHQRDHKKPPPPIAAASLRVNLPPAGSVLGQPLLPIKGSVPPGQGIAVSVNGKHVSVAEDGRFELLLPLPNGEASTVVVRARDTDGHVARIERSFKVKGNAMFLMVLADGSLTQKNTNLDQQVDTLDVGSVLLHGRGALYLKARVKGNELIKNVHFTAYADTARREEFSSFADQVIDPDRYYPVYGDASTEVTDARTRGKYYVAIEAGRNKVIVGAFRPSAWGVELLRYDRALEGVQVRLDQTWTGAAGDRGWDTVVEGFVSYADKRVKRSHALLRATGGSYYFLPDREVIEGSERIEIAIHDRDTGMRIASVVQQRDVDYRVDYIGGRLTFMKPVSSRVDASFLVGAADVLSGRLGYEGHQVWILADYETTALRDSKDVTWGINGSQKFADVVQVGGGYVREGRGEGQGPDYSLVGGSVRVTPAKRTVIEAEVGLSQAGHGANWLSDNGGLTYRVGSTEPQAVENGWGMTVRGKTDIGEFLGREEPFLEVGAHWQRQDSGFVSSRNVLQQGAEAAGGSVAWSINRKQRLTVRHDTLLTEREDVSLADGIRSTDRYLTSAQYSHRVGKLTLVGDLLHAREGDDGNDTVDRGAVAALVKYRITPRLSLWGEQQVLIGGDDRVLRSFGDHAVTGIGLDIDVTRNLSFTIGERVRWSGEDQSVIGMRAQVTRAASMYFEQRLLHARDTHRWVPSTVVGSEERWGEEGQGRSYGEYQTGNSASGPFNRAVLGLGRRFEVANGFFADVAFERYHTATVDGVADLSEVRDGNTVSVGGEYVGHPKLKLSTRFEARFETGEANRTQLVSFTRLTASLGKGVTFFAKADLAMTQNNDLSKREAETMDLQLGVVYRPLDEGFSIVFRAAHQVEMRPVGLDTEGGSLRTTADIVAIEPIIELPLRLQITPKLAFRRAVEEAEAAPSEVATNTLLAGLRLSFHLLDSLDISTEYRWLFIDELEQMSHGALAEISVTIARYARIGAGYNFSGFDDNLFDSLSRNDHGFFVRLTGMY
jgi:uncharacterized repeat protein (TIGR01451 family)